MKQNSQGLGKGLAALFGEAPMRRDSAETPLQAAPLMLPLEEVRPNPKQPRIHYDEEKLQELADSIREQGVLQPLLVRPVEEGLYEIVAGERRFRASKLAGLKRIPVVVKKLSDESAMLAALIENLQREDLNPIEEAQGLQELIRKFNLSQEEIAVRIGKSRSLVANTLRLLKLPEPIRRDIAAKVISPGQARPLLMVEDGEALEEMRRRIVKDGATSRQVERWVAFWKENRALPSRGPKKETRHPYGEIEKSLGIYFRGSVRIQGTEEKGKITIPFASKDEFIQIMRKIGLQNGQA